MIRFKIISFVFIYFNNVLCQTQKIYTNYSLFNAVPTDLDQLKFLQTLKIRSYINVIFWTRPYKVDESVQFLVGPEDKYMFIDRADNIQLRYDVVTPDIQSAFQKQSVQRHYKHAKVGTFAWDTYHSLEDIYQWLTEVALHYPEIVRLKSIGTSVEGREILAMTIKKTKYQKQRVIIESGIHGNEWIGIEFVTYLLDQMIKGPTHSGFAYLLNKYEWILIPVVNPDGTAYCQKYDRLWRKNRILTGRHYGVDLNRNFAYNFRRHGTSIDAGDDQYCGRGPFSEPESKALADFIAQKKPGLMYYISFHGYGQKIIIPYSDKTKHVENYGEAEYYARQASIKMYSINNVIYRVGTLYDLSGYRLSGNSASYVKRTFAVRFVYTFLLRDNGTYGHALPPSEILPTCKETIAGLIELMTAKPPKKKLHSIFNDGHGFKKISRIRIILFVFILQFICYFVYFLQ